MSETFRASNVYLSGMAVSRDGLAPVGPGQAQLNFALSNAEIFNGHLRMGTKLEVAITAEGDEAPSDEGGPFCEITVEYVVEMLFADDRPIENWQNFVSLADVNEFVVTTTYPLHRSRVMEATMHMEIPVLRMPQVLDESTPSRSISE